MIREVPKPKFTDLLGLAPSKTGDFSAAEKLLASEKLVGSGKGALALIFKFLVFQGIITSKLDEVLMPDWLGNWVYHTVAEYAFPAKKLSARTKVLFIYHQYGFPQDMDRVMAYAREHKLIVIEDCAHAINSAYHGQTLGTFGDFSLHSFSKWFFCFAAGSVGSSLAGFADFVSREQRQSPFAHTFFKDSVKYFYEKKSFATNVFLKKSFQSLISMSYALYPAALKISWPAKKLIKNKLPREIAWREKRYQSFIAALPELGLNYNYQRVGVTPYVIPLLAPVERLAKIAAAFKTLKVETGVYYFDVNRSMLEPDYQSCLWLPCHSDISDKLFLKLIDLIKQSL